MLYYESTYTLITLSHVISTPAHSDSETISQTNGARSSRVPIPLHDDHYMAVRQAYLATIRDSESEPFKDYRETEIPQPLPIASLLVSSSDDPYLIVGHAHTPAAIDTESEPEEAPSKTEELYSIRLTTLLSPDHPLTQTAPTPTLFRPLYYRRTARMAVRTQPAMSPGLSARVTEAMTLSSLSFRKRYRSSYETPSSSASPAPSLTLHIRKRYREDEGPDSEGKEASPKGHQRQAASVEVTTANRPLGYVPDQQVADETPTPRIPVHTTWIDPEDGTVYLDIETDPLSRAPVKTPASPECSSDSLPVSPASLTVPSPVASSMNTPATTIAVDEDVFLEVGAQLELHESILFDHTQRLDAFPPTLLEGHGWDITELFDRSRAVREEIHSQCFRLGSLERAQEQATITFGAMWRPVLALEAWAGHTVIPRQGGHARRK
ncbi:hypothetical protein Tco_1274955 [Tanacetum coccineum]